MLIFFRTLAVIIWIFAGCCKANTCYFKSRYYDQFLKKTLYISSFRYCQYGCCNLACCDGSTTAATTTLATTSEFDILSIGAIVGITISVLFFIGIACVIVYVVHRMCFTPFSTLSQKTTGKPNLTGRNHKYVQHKKYMNRQARTENKQKYSIINTKFEFGFVESENEYETIDDDSMPTPSPIVYNTMNGERRPNLVSSKAEVHISDSSSDERPPSSQNSRNVQERTILVQSHTTEEERTNRSVDNGRGLSMDTSTSLEQITAQINDLPVYHDIELPYGELHGQDNLAYSMSEENISKARTKNMETFQEKDHDNTIQEGSDERNGDLENVVLVKERESKNEDDSVMNKSMVNLRTEMKPTHTPCPRSISLTDLRKERKETQPILSIKTNKNNHALTVPDVDVRKSPDVGTGDTNGKYEENIGKHFTEFQRQNSHTLKSKRISVISLASSHDSENDYSFFDPFDEHEAIFFGTFDESCLNTPPISHKCDEEEKNTNEKEKGKRIKLSSMKETIQRRLSSAVRLFNRSISSNSSDSEQSVNTPSTPNIPADNLDGLPNSSDEDRPNTISFIQATHSIRRPFSKTLSEGNLVDLCVPHPERRHSVFNIKTEPIMEEEV